MTEKDDIFRRFGGSHAALSSCQATEGLFGHEIASVRSNFAFDQVLRSTDLHIRFKSQREFGIEFESVVRLITANLVLLVSKLITRAQALGPWHES